MRFVVIVILITVMGSGASARAQIDCSGPMPGPCRLLKQAKVVFAGAAVSKDSDSFRWRFRVTEAFKGVKGEYIEVHQFPNGGVHFEVGEQYLVFAGPCPWESADHHCLTTWPCSHDTRLEYAQALVRQLRAEKGGRRVASVYGMLWRTHREDLGAEDGGERPLANVVVRLRSGKQSYQTRTDGHGAYAFDRLPTGKYQVSADLPPDLELGDTIGKNPVPPFDLPSHSCFDFDLYALPTGEILGRLIGPDGKQLQSASAELFTVHRYKKGESGLRSFQGVNRPIENKLRPFDFYHLPPGDYLLVFNAANREDPDAPYQRTFYPGVANPESAKIIHLAAGQKILDADIHLSNPQPTRKFTVRLAWGETVRQDFYSPIVIVKASRGTQPHAHKTGESTYTLNFLLDAQYTIHAEAYCRGDTTGKVQTSAAAVDGNDQKVSEVTLTFGRGDCRRR
jgi:hypothetical protein